MHTTLSNLTNSIKNTLTSSSLKTKAILAAATLGATLGGPGVANAAVTITGLSATTVNGPTFSSNVTGAQTSGTQFLNTQNYHMQWNGQNRMITSINAGGQTFTPATAVGTPVVTARRNNVSANQNVIWYRGTGNSDSATLTMNASKVDTVEQAYADNNLWTGVDNLFVNTGDANGDNSNIERMDFVFTAGLTVSEKTGFAIFDRGGKGDHDAFKVAAVTSIDGSGNPTSYGNVLSFDKGTWGKYDFASFADSIITRTPNTIGGVTKPSTVAVQQNTGGTLITLDTMVNKNVTPVIYGYSLFAYDTNGGGNALLNWNNSAVFPTNTPATAGYGLDPLSSVFVVPEPTFTSIALSTGVGLLLRRRRSNKTTTAQVAATKLA